MAATTVLPGIKLPARKATAIKRRARDLGLTMEEYVQHLIEDDLAVSGKARSTPFQELGAPFEEAFAGLSEEELDRRVKAARKARRDDSSHRRR